MLVLWFHLWLLVNDTEDCHCFGLVPYAVWLMVPLHLHVHVRCACLCMFA